MTKINTDLDTLASLIAKQAIQDTTPFPDKLDALSKLTAYYTLLLKHKGRSSDDPDDEPTIGRFQAQLQDAEAEDADGSNGQRVPARRRA